MTAEAGYMETHELLSGCPHHMSNLCIVFEEGLDLKERIQNRDQMCALPMHWTASSLRHYPLCRGISSSFPPI